MQGVPRHPVSSSRREWLRRGLGVLAWSRVVAQDGPPHVRILFLGDGSTAHHGVPAIVGELLLSTHLVAPHIGSSLQEHFTLRQHAEDAQAMKLLQQGADDGRPWDVLVVQEQARLAARAAVDADARTTMHDGLAMLVSRALKANPKMLVVLFQPWAPHPSVWKNEPGEALEAGANPQEAHARIRLAHVNARQATLAQHPDASVLVSPVGDFWQWVREVHPAMSLHDNHGIHADLLGAMLAGLVLAATIAGREAIERSTWIGECPYAQVQRLKKTLLDRPEVFRNAGR